MSESKFFLLDLDLTKTYRTGSDETDPQITLKSGQYEFIDCKALPPPPKVETPAQTAPVEAETRRRRVVYRCPVGWQRTNTHRQPTPKVFIQTVEVEIDHKDPSGLYTPTALEIYVDPTEKRKDLAGWKLSLAVPYNHGREYLLTAENAVVNADGIVRIESPEAAPFPMTNLYWIGQTLPGFDYRLFTEENVPVDYAISCYIGDPNARLSDLESLETPRVVRSVDAPNLEWNNTLFLLSKWRVPVVETAPAAPRLSNPEQRLTTMWGALKKR